ncbi:ASCH domain-containing protein [Cohnella panacarvi]|uniref:ASCH domain-containing protein n=1 Tax=Cohnella panacarvi TaxID=400776 RepID=UPI0004786B8F|nr:ASCH domain-containing protein [Cohnella panacarvi]
MKAISIHQPWATLIAIEAKKFETRGWKTNYRGTIAIHASKTEPVKVLRTLPKADQIRIMNRYYKELNIESGAIGKMPVGSVVCTAELIECYEVHEDHTGDAVLMLGGVTKVWVPRDSDEFAFGGYYNGRFAWELTNVKLLDNPIPAKGQQGLWNWEAPQ